MRDLLGALAAPTPAQPPIEPPKITPLDALALAFAHDHALSFPHRAATVSDDWRRRYAQTHGAHQAERFRAALHRLPHPARAAIAADLMTETA
jgi:hypothetical protein